MNILRILRTRHFKLHISRRNNHTTTPTIVVVFTVMKMTFVNYAMLCCLSHVMWYCLMFVAEHLLPETNESEWKGRRVFAFSPSVSSGPSAQGWVHRTQPCEWVWIQPCLWGRPGTQKVFSGSRPFCLADRIRGNIEIKPDLHAEVCIEFWKHWLDTMSSTEPNCRIP